jgi:hypothetical protein
MKDTDTYQNHVTSWNVHVGECWFLTPVNNLDHIQNEVFLLLQAQSQSELYYRCICGIETIYF